ncbi:RNA polymerase II C-terminal domain kinase beta subunit [Podila minutissima]|nr:RNA polymerase II C-terminal domain kinase beta subunit [Podila minutissima]
MSQRSIEPQPPANQHILNSINRVSRTYYSKQEQAIIYSTRHPEIALYRQANVRRESCEVIAAIGKKIGFPQHTISTAQLLLHRFFMFHSVQDSGNEVVMACLFVSCKVEDTIKKLKDIMIATYYYRHPNATDWDSESKVSKSCLDISSEGDEQRKRVLAYEKMVLESICFDFRIIHPYKYVIKFTKMLNASKNVARQAWNIARDSYKIGVCLEYPPHTIAAGSIYLASKLLEEPLKERIYGEPWMKVLKVRSVDLEDFSYQMLDLFSIGRSEDQKERYTSVQIALNEARSLDMEQPMAKRILLEFMRPVHVEAELERIKDGGASNPTVRYSQQSGVIAGYPPRPFVANSVLTAQ